MPPPPFRERLAFDTAQGRILDADRRYLLFRADGLMGMFRRLDPATRQAAFTALAESVTEMGGKSASAYRQHTGADVDALLATIARTAPDLGWGFWAFTRQDKKVRLTVKNSPFADGYGRSHTPVCAPIVGMATAVARLAFGRDDLSAQEAACSACGASSCEFLVPL